MGPKSNQQYQEMTQLLQQGEAFMSVTPFVMTESNLNKLALSEAVDLQQYAILYKRPEELSRITLFIRPYSPFVWLCTAIAIFLIGPIFMGNTKYELLLQDNRRL